MKFFQIAVLFLLFEPLFASGGGLASQDSWIFLAALALVIFMKVGPVLHKYFKGKHKKFRAFFFRS